MKVVSAREAAALIGNDTTVACAGFVGAGHAEAVTSALEQRFVETGSPHGLTLIYSAGQGDRASRGVNHFGHAGLTRRIIGGHWRSAPKLSRLALENAAGAWNLPQGVITHLYRAIAAGTPGVITRVGLHTFVDPRHGGGRLNDAATDDLVELVTIDGHEYLRYKPLPIHCALVRGTTADARGNISCEQEAFHHEILAIAQAARNSGGIVIAQVKRLSSEPLNPQLVRLPGILVDYLVVVGDDPQLHAMTFGEAHNPAYTGEARAPEHAREVLPLDARKIVQRRALLEVARHHPRVVNLGVGMPAGIGAVAREEGVRDFTLTVEAGPIGGTPADGLSFGASENPEAIVDQPAQFDFYDGGGIDMAFLGMAELDVRGNVNVSLFGEGERRLIAGVGGFINITQSTPRVVFVGTLTAGGLEVRSGDGRLEIVREGRAAKVVGAVGQLSFNGRYSVELGTDVLYVTERAVFRLIDGRLTVVEIAPGIDLMRDVLERCGAPVAVAPHVELMDERIFRTEPMLG